jgi:serine/threonine protein kinase/formylglycine-generating enzyme required for sulfatase activity
MNDPSQTVEESGREQAPTVRAESPAQPQRIGHYWIERVLGRGGFGLVYLAHDKRLSRPVAIKVPHPHLVAEASAAEAYLTEARTVASLDHPNIVPVYDVGSTEQFPCYVVSKYIDGTDLATRLKQSRLSLHEAVELVAAVAEALHHAHKQGLVHRDVKPGNLLLDRSGKPYVTDFGLALREQDVGTGPRYAGTPAYMSPEQARGEGHRVDGRSDIFSLAVVLYELLTGRRPFRADSHAGLLEQITTVEARPPRQVDDLIPKELERICLTALSKRSSERYPTARDMADDLRHFLAGQALSRQAGGRARSDGSPSATPATSSGCGSSGTPSPTATTPASDGQLLKIVPKGLRSFDARDADFFLELLPGPRDREGLPDSIRFWKTRIEEADPDKTFPVGLIYGPSGCGKSSLVKAGLLPRLSDDVIAVYIEASAKETETRLLNGLRKRCPDLPAHPGLKEALAALRRGQGIPAGKKVLIVLDQFEQWLHAKKDEENTDLVQALRQCDGGRLQGVVMVRDDFWIAVSRFMKALEVRLLEGQNSALVDLFDVDHARKVLAAFGRAFGRLPEGTPGQEQKEFLHRAVSGLAQEGKVISVRLALFAEMLKGKPWTPATLKAVGGTQGVGVTFLEETFSAATSPPEHRYHQKAARAIMKALLPDSGTHIKGHMRSQQELVEASGYASRPRDVDDLLRILDGELRLITPTDPEGKDDAPPSPLQAGAKYYQLTHDYLVPSLRDWLTRKQKETRRGRAELLLADRAAVWNARPENRQLPSLWQWCSIRSLTQKKNWTPAERKLMRKAARYHAVCGLVAAACLVLLGFGGWESYGRLKAHTLRDRLLESTTAEVAGIVKDMAPYRRWLDPLLHEAYAQAERENEPRKQLHSSLALLPVDSGQVEYLYGRLLQAEPQEVIAIRGALLPHKAELGERLWSLLEDRKADTDVRFRAACALAGYTPDDPRWEEVSGDVAARLVLQNTFALGTWAEALQPVGPSLLPPLASFLEDENRNGSGRGVIANLYRTFAEGQPDAFARLEKALAEPSQADASAEAKVALAKRQANIGVALVVMGRGEKVWPLLKHSPDPTLRSFLIDRLAPGGVDPKALLSRFDQEQDISVKRAILLSLGEFGLDRLPPVERQNLIPRLVRLYRDDPDGGIHGLAEWLLRQWQADAKRKEIDRELATGKVEGERLWYINRQGQTMVVVPKGGVFRMGEGGERPRRRINRGFAIAAMEVTVQQFLRFRNRHQVVKEYAPSGDCPVNAVSWYDAAAYCNWLSGEEGIPKDQWCYEPNGKGEYAEGMKMAANYLQRTGYRLPTGAEWEYACRAGTETGFSFGEQEDLVGKYAWFAGNSSPSNSQPAGRLRPNDLGLFDMHGNAWERCQDRIKAMRGEGGKDDRVLEDEDDVLLVKDSEPRVLRGGSFCDRAGLLRSGCCRDNVPTNRSYAVSFRLARTSR